MIHRSQNQVQRYFLEHSPFHSSLILSIYLFIHLCIYPFMIYPPIHTSSAHQPVHLFIHSAMCLSPIHTCNCSSSVHLSIIHSSIIQIPVHPYIHHLSICPSICLIHHPSVHHPEISTYCQCSCALDDQQSSCEDLKTGSREEYQEGMGLSSDRATRSIQKTINQGLVMGCAP